MTILFTVKNLEIGGAQFFVIFLAKYLSERGHTIYIYDWEPDFRMPDIYQYLDTTKIRIISFAENKYIRSFIWKLNALLFRILKKNVFQKQYNKKRLVQYLKSIKPIIVNSHSGTTDIILTELKKNIKFTFIPSLHGEYEMSIISDDDINEILKFADGLIYTADKNLSYIHNYTKPIQKIGVGFSDDLIPPQRINKKDVGLSDDIFVIGMVARGIYEKGWEQLIQAFIRFNEQYTKTALILIGNGNYLNTLVNAYKHPHIHLIQMHEHPMKFLEYLHILDLGVLPTFFSGESYPTIIVQYIYYEIPIIATKHAEIPQMTSQGNITCARLISLKNNTVDPHDLYLSIKQLYEDKNLYQSMKNNCKIIKKKHEIRAIAQQYEDFFLRVIKQKITHNPC